MAIKLFTSTRKLVETDIEATARFYAAAGKYVKYFQEMFGKTDCEEDIYVNFKPDVAAAIRTGHCIGVFEKGVLIGCILSIDFYLYKQEHPTLFDHMFLPELEYTKQITDTVTGLTGPCMFVYAVLVEETMRCHGIATSMIKRYVKEVSKEANIVSDCVYTNANSMWLSNGFKIVDLSEELKVAVKEM